MLNSWKQIGMSIYSLMK